MEYIDLQTYKQIEDTGSRLFYKGDIGLEKLILEKQTLQSKTLFKQFIEEHNIGTPFSVVLLSEDDVIIISDIVRSYPLFYCINESSVFITENIDYIPNKKISNKNVSIFLQAGFSLGKSTIFENVFGIQAAEILIIDLKKITIKSARYNKFLPNQDREGKKIEDFVEEFDKLMLEILGKTLSHLPSKKNLIVPLSGGHDSRIIINYLKKLNAKNVICFSYGRKGNIQSRISEKVARACGFKWFFVEYTEEKWSKLHEIGIIERYTDFAFQGVSVPHLQDFLAVYELKQLEVIKEGDIFIPGHTLDMLSGGHFNESDLRCKDQKGSLVRTSTRHSIVPQKYITPSYLNVLETIYNEVSVKPKSFQEYINWQERQSKYIVNSCRVYNFFNFDFCLPLWNLKLVNYFLQLSERDRLRRNLFLSSQRNGILLPEISSIEFESEIKIKPRKKVIRKNIIPKINPFAISWVSWLFAKKNYKAESLNQIYALQGSTVKDILGSYSVFPKEMQDYVKSIFPRRPYQVNHNRLTSLIVIKKAY